MKTNITQIICSLLVLCLLISLTNAQTKASESYWHSSDRYSIELNNVGDAFVGEQIDLEGLSRYGVSTINLEIPYTNVIMYKLVSVNQTSYCPTDVYCTMQYYPYSNATPQFVNYSLSSVGGSTMLSIYLNQPLMNNSVKTLYLFFSAKGVAEKTVQGYQFSFKTVIDNNTLIREVYASVDVPQNMYLKGKTSYDNGYLMQEAVSATTAGDVAKAASSLFYSPYQYQTSNLLPGEYFTITGLYGNSTVLLYLPEIITTIALIVVAACIVKFVILPKVNGMTNIFSKKGKKDFSLIRAMLAGAISGFLFLVAYYLLMVIYSTFSYGYYNSALPILLILLSIVICSVALFGLPYYLYVTFDKKEGVVAGIIAIVAAILYLIILLYLFQPTIYTTLI